MTSTSHAPVGPTTVPSATGNVQRISLATENTVSQTATLGKRKVTGISEADAWYPGMGVPCFPFGPQTEVHQRKKHFRTSLLFLELQAQVKQAVENKQKMDEVERNLSIEIAHRNPIAFVNKATPEPAHKPATLDIEIISAKKALLRDPEIPAPLTPKILDAARKELPAGAVFSIDACLKCWREKKMAWDEVLFTIKTFASSSPSLMSAMEAKLRTQPLGEQATQAQMLELARLACT